MCSDVASMVPEPDPDPGVKTRSQTSARWFFMTRFQPWFRSCWAVLVMSGIDEDSDDADEVVRTVEGVHAVVSPTDWTVGTPRGDAQEGAIDGADR